MRESDIQTAIREYLQLRGCVVVRVNSGAIVVNDNHGQRMFRGAKAGTSDLLVCLPWGRFAAIEVKKPGEKPTDLQRAFLESVRAAGGVAMVVTRIEDVEGLFERRKNG